MVTNALNIASELAVRSNIELVVCGGSARSESYELVGPLAELTLSNINLDVAIIGVDGVHPTAGFTTHHEVEAHTNRALVRSAARVIVVADSSKIGRRGFAKIGDIATASDIVTDDEAAPEDVEELRRLGPKVHLVPHLADPPVASAGQRHAQRRRQQVAVRGDHVVGQLARSPCTGSVAEVFGSTIMACRTYSGRPWTAAWTVSSTTDRNCRFSAAHCGGRSPTATGSGAGSVRPRKGPRPPRPARGW